MGADSQAKPMLCAKTAELIDTGISNTKLTMQTSTCSQLPSLTELREELSAQDSTLDPAQFQKALTSCSSLAHEQEVDKTLKDIGSHTPILPSEIGTDFNFKREIVWKNVIGFAALHICGWIGLHLAFWLYCDWRTTLYCEYGIDFRFFV